MPEKKQGQVILMSEQQMKTMPILAMRDVCVLPGMLVHLDVSREITKRAIEEAMAEDGSIFLTLQRDESIETPSFHDLYEIGVIAKIKQEVKVKDDVLRVMISTKERGNLLSLNQTKPFLKGEVVPYEWGDEELRPGALEKEAMCRNLKDVYTIYLNENPRASRSDFEKIQGMKDLGKLTDLIAMHINMGFDKRQEILECLDLELRYEMVAGILTNEVNLSRIREGYRRKVKEEVDKNQKEYFLREQMKVIRNELGDGASAEEYQEKYKEQLEQLSCSEEVYQKIAEEIIENAKASFRKFYEKEKGVPFDKTRVYPSETWFRFVVDRKPLLLIYLIDVGVAEENQKKQEAEFKAAMGNTPAVGLALGLPRNDEEAGLTSTRYKVNRVYNWFDREEMEDILAEGREE